MKVIKVTDPQEYFPESPIKRSKPLPPCEIEEEGKEYVVGPDMVMPEGICHWAWNSINSAVKVLLFGGSYPWMEEPTKQVVCCTDGLRPVVYLLERV
ncbi:MAG: TIGR04076 family protein [Candidatus Bathyarchaeota archaeon]|nr:TIGR04076 family protein [Candidatus Bathyarchaeota archaeon]